MYVRAELVDGTKSNGLLVPQVAVSRDEKGNPTVLIVGPENKVEMRKITAPRTIGTSWLVTSGLKPGEKIIVDGAQMLRPGIAVKAVPAQQGSDQSGQRPAQRGQSPTMSRYFIDSPIFAWVIAIVMMMAGAIAIRILPIPQFPATAPPTVTIRPH